AMQEFRAEQRAKRIKSGTPLWPSHLKRLEREKEGRGRLKLRDAYDHVALRLALARGIERANVERAKEKPPLAPIPHWTPYQLRHAAATRIEKELGIEASRRILGNSSATTTAHYVKADIEAACAIAEKIG